MTAVLPSLFGTPGRAPSARYLATSVAQVCISREFTMFATNKTSPVVRFLRELAAHEHAAYAGPGVGVVGMCLTGGFALAMSVEPSVVAPVLSQPSLPVGWRADQRRALGLRDDDLRLVKNRTSEGLCVLGLRFKGDHVAPGERFDRLRDELGDQFIGVEIDSTPMNPWGYPPKAHSVLTEDYSDAPGSPTREALTTVLEFLSTRLGVAPPPT